MSQSDIPRRDFVAQSAAAASAAALGLGAGSVGAQEAAPDEAPAKPKVVVVTAPKVIDRNQPVDNDVLRAMMSKGVQAFTGKESEEEAWQAVVKPTDRVALADAGTWLLNVPEVLFEIIRGIGLAKPAAFRFTVCKHTMGTPQYMEALAKGFKERGISEDIIDGDVYGIPGSFYNEPLDLIVMAPTLKSHSIAGVSGVIKHYATMSKDHVSKFHANGMESAGLAFKQEFAKFRNFIIVDALRFGNQRQGPQFYQKSLIFGTDPVATDVVALDIFLKNCKPDEKIDPHHHRIQADKVYGIGVSDLDKIERVEITL